MDSKHFDVFKYYWEGCRPKSCSELHNHHKWWVGSLWTPRPLTLAAAKICTLLAQPWSGLGHRLSLALGLCWEPFLIQQCDVAVTLQRATEGSKLFVGFLWLQLQICNCGGCCGGHGEKNQQRLICSPWFSILHCAVTDQPLWKMQPS